MPTRNIVLTERQSELVERLVASGRYQNASEVLREGLRLIENRDAEEKIRLKALRDAASRGMTDIDTGRFRSFDAPEAFNDYLESLAERAIHSRTVAPRRK